MNRFSPDPTHHQISPRQSLGNSISPRNSSTHLPLEQGTNPSPIISRPRPRPGSAQNIPATVTCSSTSAPTSRPSTPTLSRQNTTSPTGSVHSPQTHLSLIHISEPTRPY